jgi:hypothetical protein
MTFLSSFVKIKYFCIGCYKNKNKKIKLEYEDAKIIYCYNLAGQNITNKVGRLLYLHNILNTKTLFEELKTNVITIEYSKNSYLYSMKIDLFHNKYEKHLVERPTHVERDQDILFNMITF